MQLGDAPLQGGGDSATVAIRGEGCLRDLRSTFRDGRVLVQRDFISRYKQTILGPLWHLLQPLITAGVYVVVFRGIAGMTGKK